VRYKGLRDVLVALNYSLSFSSLQIFLPLRLRFLQAKHQSITFASFQHTYCLHSHLYLAVPSQHQQYALPANVRGHIGCLPGPPPADKKTFRQNLREFAEGIYNRLRDELRGEVIYGKGYNLVAALFMPNKGIFLSTIPRKSGAEAMAADWKTKAPRLSYATGGHRNSEEDHSKILP
jgi:hypothetical protein